MLNKYLLTNIIAFTKYNLGFLYQIKVDLYLVDSVISFIYFSHLPSIFTKVSQLSRNIKGSEDRKRFRGSETLRQVFLLPLLWFLINTHLSLAKRRQRVIWSHSTSTYNIMKCTDDSTPCWMPCVSH